MKVVIDTSIVISAALKTVRRKKSFCLLHNSQTSHGSPRKQSLRNNIGVIQRPKFGLPDAITQRWIHTFQQFVTIADVQATDDFPRDQKDAKFLACAVAADAQYLITGDKDFREAYKIARTTVISVRLFKEQVVDVW